MGIKFQTTLETSRMARSILAIALLTFMSSVSASFFNGNDLVAIMRDYERAVRSDPSTDYKNATEFRGYTLGVFDSMQERGELCRTNNVTKGQIGSIVAKFLNENPEKWSEPAAILVTTALVQAFPCKQ